MATNSVIPALEKLSGRENYNDWCFAMKAYLEYEDLWSCVTGTDPTTNEAEKLKRDTKAKSKLIMMVSSQNFIHIRSANTAKEVWDKLKDAFEDSGLIRKVSLMRKLITTKLENCASVEEYISTIMSTAQKLNDINFEVSSEWVGTFLLAGLPETYSPMIMALENSDVTITADYVKTKLLQDVKQPNSADSKAFYTPSNHQRSTRSSSKIRCYNCNNFGHFAKNCKKPKKKSTLKSSEKNHSVEKSLFSVLTVKDSQSESEWYLDSGASSHMTPLSNILSNISLLSDTKEVMFADGRKVPVKNKGDCKLDIKISDKISSINVKDVLHVPDLTTNLLSVSRIAKAGKKVIFEKNKCTIEDENEIVATATLHGDMYRLDTWPEKSFSSISSTELWHRRLGHPSDANLKKMKNININQEKCSSSQKCVTCLKGKQPKKPFLSSKSETTEKLQLVHTDLCGPMDTNSIGGSRYVLTFLDDFSHMAFVYFLKTKDEVTNKFIEFKNMVENQSGQKIKILRSDNGGEFVNHRLSNQLKDAGIIHQTTIPYNPQQNGKAERLNRTIMEKARCLLFDSHLPKRFWAEAVNTATYLINRSPTRALPDNKVPIEVWSGKGVNLSNLRIFGSKVMVQIPSQNRKKLDPKSTECIFVGYPESQKGYRVYDPKTDKVTVTRDAVFIDESSKVKLSNLYPIKSSQYFLELEVPCEVDAAPNSQRTSSESEDTLSESQVVEYETQFLSPLNRQPVPVGTINEFSEYDNSIIFQDADDGPVILSSDTVEDESSPAYSSSEGEIRQTSTPVAPRRSSRAPKPNYRPDFVYSLKSVPAEDPSSIEEALSGPDATQWKLAMDDEYKSLMDNDTWTLSDLPEGRTPIKTKWVLKTKRNPDGTVRYKARLVVKGCSQKKGIDYSETFSPVVKYTSVRYLLAMAVQENLDIDHLDAKTAFLQGDLEETIYTEQPQGYEVGNKVCKLRKSIYGLKQSSRNWNSKLHGALTELGLKNSKTDNCVYYLLDTHSKIYIAVYVDDLILFTNNVQWKEQLKVKLNQQFKMKDLGPINQCLGFRITRDRNNGKLWLDQHDYALRILRRFNMTEAHATETPVELGSKMFALNHDDRLQHNEVEDNFPYKEAVGSLLYLAQCTRPDLLYAVNLVSRFSNNPTNLHWMMVKRILRYVKGSISYRLEYSGSNSSNIIGFCDADWGSDKDRKSTTGYFFTKGLCAISWNTRKQPTVALSTTEAEYMAISSAVQEAIWLRSLEKELNSIDQLTITIFCDNLGAIALTSNSVHHQRTKHIDIKHHFIRDSVAARKVQINPISTKDNIADIFTKGLPHILHKKFVNLMNININFSGDVEIGN